MNIWFVRIDAGSDVRSASHTTTTATRYPHEGAFRRLIDNFDLAVLRVALQTSVKPHGGVKGGRTWPSAKFKSSLALPTDKQNDEIFVESSVLSH